MTEARSRSRPFLVALATLLLIIALGELYALYLQYENNVYFQQYVSENQTPLLVQATGLIALALGGAYLSYLAVRAKPASRMGRFSRKLLSFSPVIAGVAALALWFGGLSNVVGGSTINFEVYIVIVLLIISLGMMTRDRLTLRMSLRNFTRRKTSMALVIAGLMIGTAMISGSLVTGDTLTELFTRGAYFGYGHADEVVYARNSTTSGFTSSNYQFFGLSIYQGLSSRLSSDPSVGREVLGVTPEIIDTVSVFDVSKGLVQAGAALIGSFSNASRVLGDFHSADGSVITSSFGDTEAVLNDQAARDLNATVGDAVTVYSAQRLNFTVVGIAISDARGSFTQGDDVFVTLNSAQKLTSHQGSANYVAITNIGGLRDSIQYSQAVGLAANRTLNTLYAIVQPPLGTGCKAGSTPAPTPPSILCAYSEKKNSVDSATEGAKSISSFFLILSTFAILAGIVLIVNIFVMLAEERKSEMGMARAVGMRRGQLTRMFLFEGSLYAAGASLVGVLVGIGVAYAILYAIGTIFMAFLPVSMSQVLGSFTFTASSLFTAFAEGLLITYVSILLTSWRISRLNIIRAIRNVPEPPRGRRTYTLLLVLGLALAVGGVLLFRASFEAKSAMEALVGPSLVIFGTGLVLSRLLRNRYAFTLAGTALVIQWAIPSLSWDSSLVANYTLGPEVFIVGGIIMVTGAIIVVMYNTDVVLKALRLLLRGRRTLTPIFKIALSYPENKRFRTAATVAMFALVLFTVSAVASIEAELNASISQTAKEQSGSYDIATRTVPLTNLTALVTADPTLRNELAAVIPFSTTLLTSAHDANTARDFPLTTLVGADPDAPTQNNFFTTNSFKMLNITKGFQTATDVWNALRSNSSYVVWSVSFSGNSHPNPGDTLILIEMRNATLISRPVKVLGILQGLFDGVVGIRQLLMDPFGVETGTLALVKVTNGFDPVNVSNLLKREFIGLGMQTTVIEVAIEQGERIFTSFFGLFEGYLALGLVVGIAGLGIISVRSVVERRQEIGILRALGFRRRMVLAAFLLESSYVTLLGIMIGVSLGVDLAYAFTVQPNSGLSFVIPWLEIIEISVLSYLLAILSTVGSARRAAKIPPAEALRYSE